MAARIQALREGKSLSAVVRELLTQWLEKSSGKQEVSQKPKSKKPSKRK